MRKITSNNHDYSSYWYYIYYTIFYVPITTETFEFFKNNYKKLRLKKFTNKVHDKFNLDVKLVETWCSVGIQFEFADTYQNETFDFAEIGSYVFDYLGLVVWFKRAKRSCCYLTSPSYIYANPLCFRHHVTTPCLTTTNIANNNTITSFA